MSAADDYPNLTDRARGLSSWDARLAVLAHVDSLRVENDELRDVALNRQPARIVWLEAENARLKARLADARDADAALHDHITNGGRI